MMSLDNVSVGERRAFMANVFEVQSASMASAVDKLTLARRTIPPYVSDWGGASISEHGPIPTDLHLMESKHILLKREPAGFQGITNTSHTALPRDGRKPYYAFELTQPKVFEAAPRGARRLRDAQDANRRGAVACAGLRVEDAEERL